MKLSNEAKKIMVEFFLKHSIPTLLERKREVKK